MSPGVAVDPDVQPLFEDFEEPSVEHVYLAVVDPGLNSVMCGRMRSRTFG